MNKDTNIYPKTTTERSISAGQHQKPKTYYVPNLEQNTLFAKVLEQPNGNLLVRSAKLNAGNIVCRIQGHFYYEVVPSNQPLLFMLKPIER